MYCKRRRNAERERELVMEKRCVAIAANSFSREKDRYSAGEGGNAVARIQ